MSRFPVRFRWDDVIVQSYASDVTESSLFVPCPIPPPAKTRLPIRLFLPDGRGPEEVETVVRSAGAGGPTGFFCELVGMTPSGLERLRGVIPSRAPQEPVDGEDLLRDIVPETKAVARAGNGASPLHDLVLGALDDAGQEIPVSSIMAPPGPSVSRPLPRRATNEPPRAPTSPPQIAPVMQPAVERRASPRAAIHFKLKFGNPRSFIEQHAEDISAGGIFVATTREVPVGTMVQLTLFLPDGGEPVETHARVVRIARADGPEKKAGLGLQFLDENPALSARIVRLVEQHAG